MPDAQQTGGKAGQEMRSEGQMVEEIMFGFILKATKPDGLSRVRMECDLGFNRTTLVALWKQTLRSGRGAGWLSHSPGERWW